MSQPHFRLIVNRRSLKFRVQQLVALLVVVGMVFSWPLADEKKFQPEKIGKGLNFFSQNQEIEMGRSYSSQLNGDLTLVDDPQITRYVEQVGRRLVDASMRRDLEYRFFVVNTKEVNAFALPGGFIYVNRGLIETTDNESELAGVIGHEIGHVVGKHSLKQLSKKLLLAGITVGAGLAVSAKSKKWGEIVSIAGGVGLFFASLKYSRDDEREADYLGMTELHKAGYSPWGMVSFFEKLESESKGRGMPAFLSTHPLPRERKANMRQQIAELNLGEPGLMASSRDFERCKTRLAGLWSPPPAKEKTLSNALTALRTDTDPSAGDEAMSRQRRTGAFLKSARIPGDSTWVDTGIDVQAGDLVKIDAAGKVYWKKNSAESCGPDGVPGKGFWKPISSANTGALIGKIGVNSTDYFVIGSRFSQRMTGTGRLFLGINDDNNFDNRGEFEVRIHVGPLS